MLFRSQGVVCLFIVCCVTLSTKVNAADPPTEITQKAQWQSRIEAALATKGDWDFFEAPLTEVCNNLQIRLGVDFAIDTKALEDWDIDPETQVTRSIKGITCRSFLRILLRDLELTYTIQDGALLVTTDEEAQASLTARVYPVGDLLLNDSTFGRRTDDYDQLTEAIVNVVAPDSWSMVGGPGSIAGIHGTIVVSQTQDVHEELVGLLEVYRRIAATKDDLEPVYFLGESDGEAKIRRTLEEPVTAEFEDASLKDIVELLSESAKVPMVIDTAALEDFGIDTATRISGKFLNTPLKHVLGRALASVELTYIIRDEMLVVTTPEECECTLPIGLYPVEDLVVFGEELIATPDGATNADFDLLIEVIESTIAPDTWAPVGGPSDIGVLLRPPTLIIPQMESVHEDIVALLTKLRAAKQRSDRESKDLDANRLFVRSYPLELSDCTADEVAKLVTRATDKKTWQDEEGAFIQGLGNSLIVKHNASVQWRIRRLLIDFGVTPSFSTGCFVCPPGLGGGLRGNTNAGETNGGGGMPASNGPTAGGFF